MKKMVNKFLEKLSQNLLETLNDEEYYDITIEVGTDPHVKVFRAHMVILNYRSSYLRRILSTNKKKDDGILVHIKFPNILPEIFHVLLRYYFLFTFFYSFCAGYIFFFVNFYKCFISFRYVYGGKLSLEEYDASDIIKILVTANELGHSGINPIFRNLFN